MTLPPLLGIAEIQSRLEVVFPEGVEARTYLVRQMAAKVVYVLLYGGMVEGVGRFLRPAHVYFFTDEQAVKTTDAEREAWFEAASRPRFRPAGKQWYADTTREPIRDETLRYGLVAVGAVRRAADRATTSSMGTYCLAGDFAALFDPRLPGESFDAAVQKWQKKHLTPPARARMKLLAAGKVKRPDEVLVDCPDGTVAKLSAGPSSLIAKAVIEVFAPSFLPSPALVWLSESAAKVRFQDAELAAGIGLAIDAAKVLPDIILANVGESGEDTTLIFIEVVASDGPMDTERKARLLEHVAASGFPAGQVSFGTAFEDRRDPAFRKCMSRLAWGTFAWFRTEPQCLVWLHEAPFDITVEERAPRRS